MSFSFLVHGACAPEQGTHHRRHSHREHGRDRRRPCTHDHLAKYATPKLVGPEPVPTTGPLERLPTRQLCGANGHDHGARRGEHAIDKAYPKDNFATNPARPYQATATPSYQALRSKQKGAAQTAPSKEAGVNGTNGQRVGPTSGISCSSPEDVLDPKQAVPL